MKLENPVHIKPFRRAARALPATSAPASWCVPTAPERHRNADTHYDYRWDSGFYYLTGFREPEAVLVMVLGAKPRSILFCREKNLEREIWDGFRYGPGAGARACSASTRPIAYGELDARMPDLLADQDALHTPVGVGPGVGRARGRLAERGARQGAHRRHRARRRSATCAPP